MARSRYTARVSRGTSAPRRKFIWARTSASGTLGPDSIFRVNMLDNFEGLYGAELIGATIVRIRGILGMTTDTASGEQFIAAAMVEPDPVGALDVGEGPTMRPYAPWMLYEPFMNVSGGATDVTARLIDVKAARRIDELNEQLSLYLQTPGNTGTIGYSFTLSIGVKLP